MKPTIIFDLEGDGLNPTKIHVLSWMVEGENEIHSTASYKVMEEVLRSAGRLIGHNIILFDLPVLERILGISINAELVDTLGISWYLYPKKMQHGLEWWGEDFGVPKPKIDDWKGLDYEQYRERCEEDVKITCLLWEKQKKDLFNLYENESYERLVKYLSFKLGCVRLQEESGWKLDKEKCLENLELLEMEFEKKREELLLAMPKVAKYVVKTRPKKPFKKDGSLSSVGERWKSLCEENNLPFNFNGEIRFLSHNEEPNPNSVPQVKDWLFSLGWVPENFKYERDKETGDVKKIPQIKSEKDDGTLCPSVKVLSDEEPSILLLEGYGVLKHRIGILKGFLRDENAGFLKARVAGFTNTLRFKHRELVNLPGVGAAFGKQIRECLVAPEGYELCGSDQSSLEDRTKQHYMYEYDPEYVEEMNKPGFDPHLDLALNAKALSQEQVRFYKESVDKPKDIHAIRHMYKSGNYACVYGVGKSTLARTLKSSTALAERVIEAYWKRNWSVKVVAESQKVKTINGQMWLFNPVSKLWYSLRHTKDIFSTLNQGTGVYCFDTWIKWILSKRKQLTGQFHDEIILTIKKGSRNKCEELLKWALMKANQQLKLNRELGISIDFGNTYAEIH